MKKNLTRIAALLLVFAMIFAFAACKDNDTDTETTTAAAGEVEGTEAKGDDTAEGTEAVSGDATDVSAEDSTAAEETETDASGNVVEPEAAAKPATKDDIIKYYNDATAKAFNSKVGFKKYRITGNEKIDSNAIVEKFKDVIYKFMGIGAANAYSETVVKGKWDADTKHHYLRTSTLGAGDVTNATCTESGSNYVITMNIAPGTTHATKGTIKNDAPLDKCGICVGDEDKSYYDHKRASVIYDAISEMFGSAIVDESYKNAVVTATIDAATGNLVKLVVKFDIAVTTQKTMGTISATGTSTVTYSDFKY